MSRLRRGKVLVSGYFSDTIKGRERIVEARGIEAWEAGREGLDQGFLRSCCS